MKPLQTQFTVTLPDWLIGELQAAESCISSRLARMRFVIDLSRRNVDEGTGGPFAAAVFDSNEHKLLSAAVNVVVPSACSAAHAEIVALALAQKRLATHDLNSVAGLSCELVTSTEPCAMCLGAVQWSGISSLTCGARGDDACAAGFDEGAKPPDWAAILISKGVSVTQDVCRTEAAKVLSDYAREGGPIYNPGSTA